MPTWFRPSHGFRDPVALTAATAADMDVCYWSIRPWGFWPVGSHGDAVSFAEHDAPARVSA